MKQLVDAARLHGARAVAHGCADGDWVETGVGDLAPELEVLAPARDFAWTRAEAVRWVRERAVPIDVTRRSPYSADRTALARPAGTAPQAGDPEEIVVTFDRGVPVAFDGETVTAFEAVRELNRRAGGHGVGGLADVEAPGAVALVTAHRALEAVTLDRDTARFKRTAEGRWGELVLDGLWFAPLRNALDAFVETTQEHVSGEVRLLLHAGRAVVDGRRGDGAPHDSTLDTRDEGDTVEQLWDLPSKRDLNK